MREGVFNIHEKGYPTAFHNTEVKYQQGETVAEIVSCGHAESEEAIVRAFYGQFNIRASGDLKKRANEGGATVADLAGILQGFKILAERRTGGGGGNPEALAKARETREAQKAAKSKLEAIQAAAASDPKIAAQLEKLRNMGVEL
jgi:hypothetical protein